MAISLIISRKSLSFILKESWDLSNGSGNHWSVVLGKEASNAIIVGKAMPRIIATIRLLAFFDL